MSSASLTIRNFAHLREVTIPLRDIIVVVGPQATGKSLALQLFKLCLDRTRIVRVLRDQGFSWQSPSEFAALYFGAGFERAWRDSTDVAIGTKPFTLQMAAESRGRDGEEAVYFVPAHRTLTISEGWPRRIPRSQSDAPYVARRFAEQLLELMNTRLAGATKLFPQPRRLKAAFRKSIDEAVFHGGLLRLETQGMRRQFVIDHGEQQFPFMAWTAGQREFITLLLGLYHLLTAGQVTKRPDIEWVVIEEPEMGLHPKAIVSVMGLVFELLHRGYKVVLSTHSPVVLDILWAVNRLRRSAHGSAHLCDVFEMSHSVDVLGTMSSALTKDVSVVHLRHGKDQKVESVDISALSPGAEDAAEAGWGGLTGFSGHVASVVAKAANERKAS